MNDKAQQDEAQEQQVRVGFEALLDKFVPTWSTNGDDPAIRNAIEFSRAVYMQALNDASVFINNSLGSLAEGHNWLTTNARTIAIPVAAEGAAPDAEEVVKRGETTSFAAVDTFAYQKAADVSVGTTYPMETASLTPAPEVASQGGTFDGGGASASYDSGSSSSCDSGSTGGCN